MSDYYDRAVEYFCERPRRITPAWFEPTERPFGQLFAFLSPKRSHSGDGGCPAMIRRGFCAHPSVSKELEKEIRSDERISLTWPNTRATPDELRSILTAFADWQRRIDRELNRTEPVEEGQ